MTTTLYRLLVTGFALGAAVAIIAIVLGWGLHGVTLDLATLPGWSFLTFAVCAPASLLCGLFLWLTADGKGPHEHF